MGIEVLCEGGSRRPLREIFLPLPHLKNLCSRYIEDEARYLPFLQLEEPIVNEESGTDWIFLDNFGVTRTDGLGFYLTILRIIVAANPEPDDMQQIHGVLNLYKAIHAKCISSSSLSGDPQDDRELDRARLVYISPTDPGQC